MNMKIGDFFFGKSAVAKDKITFVLPIARSDTGRDEHDIQRMSLLLRTLRLFFDNESIDQLLIIAPLKDIPDIQSASARWKNSLKIEVIDEVEICPEFLSNPDTHIAWPKPNKGWYRQQLIKLAAHTRIRTPFYMTLDSDVIFFRPFTITDLIVEGKALLNVQVAEDYKRVYVEGRARREVDVRIARYKEAARVLKCDRNEKYQDQWYGETPVLMHTELVRSMAQHIEEKWGDPWRDVLLKQLPWTEYALYFLYLEEVNALETNYYFGGFDTLLRLSDSLWFKKRHYLANRSLSTWRPQFFFNKNCEGVAVVVQSHVGYNIRRVKRKISPHLWKRTLINFFRLK